LARGAYFVPDGDRAVSRRSLIRAAVLSPGPGATAVLGTAAELHGLAGLPRSDDIHVSVPPGRAKQRVNGAIRVHQWAARRCLAEADGRAQLPLETRVRLRCRDGGVPPDDLQHAVRDDDGYLRAVADLAWRRAALLAEADGVGPHGTPPAVYQDRRRQNRLAHAGWRVLRFTRADTLRADHIPCVARAALRRAAPGAGVPGR
jgi:hypothetical protein